MNVKQLHKPRRGTVLPMLAVSLIGLFSFVGLAIDLGLLALARTNCQNAADIAALAGTRQLNNNVTDTNRTAALAQAKSAVYGTAGVTNSANYDVNTAFTSAQIQSVTAGQYAYNTTSQTFSAIYPNSIGIGQSWTAMQVILSTKQPTFFMKIWGVSSMPMSAAAVAVHRPRDVALAIDMTGSMGFGSQARMADQPAESGAKPGINDPNSIYPSFGHYQRYTSYGTNNITSSETGATIGNRPNPFQQMGTVSSGGYVYAPANLTIETYNGPAIVRDFYYDPSNLSNMTTAVTSTNGTTFKNAFHQWSPGTAVAGDPTNLIGPTYDFTGYNALDTTGTHGSMPAPDNFKDQSDSPNTYVGDKYPRKWGATTGTTWDPTNANGAAINLAEYLGWIPKYTGSGTWPGSQPVVTRTTFVPSTAYVTSGSGTTFNWADFRDATWERYGYDLDVADYIANRGSTWDPRWDWNKTTSTWAHYRPSGWTTANAYRPKLKATTFKGYSMGPGYYGKTFFIWPPDPRTPVGNPSDASYVPGDWRLRYFYDRSGNSFNTQADADSVTTGWQSINGQMFTDATTTTNGGLTLNASSGNWGTNYGAILKWIKSGPMTLPPNLRSGHVLYYSSIPDDVNTSTGSSDQQADKYFWQQYIDYVLRNGNLAGPEPKCWPEGLVANVDTATSTGTPYPLPTSPSKYLNASGATMTADPVRYCGATDNPSRPRMHFWFGPLTMLMFLNDNRYWSGSTHQAQSWQLKAGIKSSIDDIRSNHPNDNVGMAYFTYGEYTDIVVPIGQDYTTLKNALFFPKTILPNLWNNTTQTGDKTKELRVGTSSSFPNHEGDIPNAQANTDPVTGMALAFNILSPAPSLNADATRRGRRGASKVVIFETDGIPNSRQGYTYQKAGYNSYYKYTAGNNANDGNISAASSAAVAVVSQIAKQVASDTSSDSGYSLPNSPARVYAIGFGDIFSTSSATAAESFLLSIQQAGNTSGATDTSIPTYQIITGPYQTRINNLQDGLQRIMQSGVQVTLIQ